MSPADLTVTATEAKRSLSRLLKAAKAGQRVTITWRGRPAAVLGPVERKTEALYVEELSAEDLTAIAAAKAPAYTAAFDGEAEDR